MRKPVVSRKLTVTKCNVLVLNLTTRKSEEKIFYLARQQTNNEKMLKIINSFIDQNNYKAAHIVSHETTTLNCSIPEQDYLNLYLIIRGD